ncbi:MAG: polyprenyl synthetase family protein [Candidatus Aminicenantes bacterium]|nr:polyprenyl synthetase family protein [Candidatus Aminicenantes bacterium]
MKAEARLAAKKRLIEKGLDRLLKRDDEPLFRAMRYAVLPGGKRFRPLLLLASGSCFGVSPPLLLPFASALELIHCYSLVHDDLPSMDNDDFRRGKPSLHRAFGENLAILAGDGLLSLAFETMAGAAVPRDKMRLKQEAIQVVSRNAGAAGMVGGQALEIGLKPGRLTRARTEALIQKKTGALILAAVEVGAIFGRARAAEQRAVGNFGRSLGLAFQVRDDILDARKENRAGFSGRADYVALVGKAKAGERLEALIRKAVVSLEGFPPRADELRFLARSLLPFETEVDHAQTAG